MLDFIIILVCNFTFSSCTITQQLDRPFRDETVCVQELKRKMGTIRASIPVPGKWRIVGWCGLPVSGMKAGA